MSFHFWRRWLIVFTGGVLILAAHDVLSALHRITRTGRVAMSFHFWRRWLIVVTGAVLVYGTSLLLLPDLVQRFFFAMYYFAADAAPVFNPEAHAYTTFAHAVLGAVIIGWMVTLLSVIAGSFQPRQPGAWNTLALSVGTWFVVDTGYSLYTGILSHAVFNTLFLILFAIPLAATYRHTRPASP